MPQTCKICRHDERTEIDQLLVGSTPLRRIAAQTGASASALARHKRCHLPMALVKAKQADDQVEAGTLFERLQSLSAEARAILQQAKASNDRRTALAAIGKAERLLELEARLTGELSDAAKIAIGISVPSSGLMEFRREIHALSPERLAVKAQQLADQLRQDAGLDRPS